MPDYERLVGPEEAAEFLGCSPAQVRKLAREKAIPCVPFGFGVKRVTYRFYLSALDEYYRRKLLSPSASTPQKRSA